MDVKDAHWGCHITLNINHPRQSAPSEKCRFFFHNSQYTKVHVHTQTAVPKPRQSASQQALYHDKHSSPQVLYIKKKKRGGGGWYYSVLFLSYGNHAFFFFFFYSIMHFVIMLSSRVWKEERRHIRFEYLFCYLFYSPFGDREGG